MIESATKTSGFLEKRMKHVVDKDVNLVEEEEDAKTDPKVDEHGNVDHITCYLCPDSSVSQLCRCPSCSWRWCSHTWDALWMFYILELRR